jgi:20S proteasome alpha/beta subunit
MILPYLDCETIGYNNPNFKDKAPLNEESAVELLTNAFVATAERDIYTGDKLEIVVLNKEGAKTIWKQLRKD